MNPKKRKRLNCITAAAASHFHSPLLTTERKPNA
jgi:hypothetical protein